MPKRRASILQWMPWRSPLFKWALSCLTTSDCFACNWTKSARVDAWKGPQVRWLAKNQATAIWTASGRPLLVVRVPRPDCLPTDQFQEPAAAAATNPVAVEEESSPNHRRGGRCSESEKRSPSVLGAASFRRKNGRRRDLRSHRARAAMLNDRSLSIRLRFVSRARASVRYLGASTAVMRLPC